MLNIVDKEIEKVKQYIIILYNVNYNSTNTTDFNISILDSIRCN